MIKEFIDPRALKITVSDEVFNNTDEVLLISGNSICRYRKEALDSEEWQAQESGEDHH
jgi:hypothetical protein